MNHDPASGHDRSLPLEGLKVADFSWVVAGPVVGRALADFGATVVRIESGTRIETARMMQPFYRGEAGPENSALYGDCNAGKYGLALNLKTSEGRGVARDLVAWADVVAESYAPGQLFQVFQVVGQFIKRAVVEDAQAQLHQAQEIVTGP